MKIKLCSLVLSLCVSAISHAASLNEKAKDFTLADQDGKSVTLSSFKGKYIILEWFNDGCPFVKKHYSSGNMQGLQKLYKDNDQVVWLTIGSSTEGKQGYFKDMAHMKELRESHDMQSNHLLRDSDGKVGQIYDAKTTPHIYIIDPNFDLKYMGAIDSIPSADSADISKSTNYITSSINALMLKKDPNPQKTKPYGCSVKY